MHRGALHSRLTSLICYADTYKPVKGDKKVLMLLIMRPFALTRIILIVYRSVRSLSSKQIAQLKT